MEYLDIKDYCTGCGSPHVAQTRLALCQFCYDRLMHELKIRRDDAAAMSKDWPDYRYLRGPNYLCSFFTGQTTLGHGLYISTTPAEAMAEATRLALRNNWVLLRLDIQKSLIDIFRHESFSYYFKGTQKREALPFNEERYGPVPPLYQLPPSVTHDIKFSRWLGADHSALCACGWTSRRVGPAKILEQQVIEHLTEAANSRQ